MAPESKNKKKAKADSTAAQRNGVCGAVKVISDPRFASVHSDPRFREAPRKNTKVAIDSRFNRMFTDKNFASSKSSIDKRGRRKKDESQNKLKHYYHLEEEAEKEREQRKEELLREKKSVESESEEVEEEESEKGESESEESKSESESEEELLKKGLHTKNESESEGEEDDNDDDDEEDDEEDDGDESSSTSTTDSDEEEDGVDLEQEDAFGQPVESVPVIEKETHRLAVVNMDWSQVKAEDLYVLLSSFLPREGQIKSVAVYPSEFGLKRMGEEAVRGPVGLFDDEKVDNENVDDDNDDDDDEEVDQKKLRTYELSRLRYYYAVVDCDSSATADYLYKTCDGVEFERSSIKLDLRFIPDSMEFNHQPRDIATEAPASYEGLDFEARALQQSKVHISWDDDEPQRLKLLRRKFNDDQLAELERKEILASDESETDDDEAEDGMDDKSDKKREREAKYRALLGSGNGSDENDEEDNGQEMEFTFNTGLEELSKRIQEKKDKKSETVWEEFLRKRKEKKKARKSKSKNLSEEESSDTDQEPAVQHDDFFMQESSDKAPATLAELELIVADDNNGDPGLKGFNLKRKKLKGKKGKEVPDEGKLPTVDYDDPRFSALYSSPLFALDPTDPQFKRSAPYIRQLAQKQQQKSDSANITGKKPPEMPGQAHLPEDKDKRFPADELSSLIRSVQMKSIPKAPESQPPSKKRKKQRGDKF